MPTRSELDAAIFEAVGDPLAWSAESLGQCIALTFVEYRAMTPNPRTIRPCDATPAEVKAYQHEKKRKRDRAGAKARRAAERERRAARQVALQANADLDVRAEALYSAIGSAWTNVAELMRDVGHFPAWRMPNGRRLTGASLARVMRRELDGLIAAGKVGDLRKPGKRGACVRLFRRRKPSVS